MQQRGVVQSCEIDAGRVPAGAFQQLMQTQQGDRLAGAGSPKQDSAAIMLFGQIAQPGDRLFVSGAGEIELSRRSLGKGGEAGRSQAAPLSALWTD